MTHAEFLAWLDREVRLDRMRGEQRDDLLKQKQLFDEDLPAEDEAKRNEYRGWIVAYVASQRRRARDIRELLERAKREYPGRMMYFEPIGFDLW